MMSKMRMTAAFLAAALCMTVFPVTVFAAGTETEEVMEMEGAAAPETEALIEEEETVADEGDIDEEALKELLDGSLEITVTEDGIVDGGGEAAEESQDDFFVSVSMFISSVSELSSSGSGVSGTGVSSGSSDV